jgi:hypothetical protein
MTFKNRVFFEKLTSTSRSFCKKSAIFDSIPIILIPLICERTFEVWETRSSMESFQTFFAARNLRPSTADKPVETKEKGETGL